MLGRIRVGASQQEDEVRDLRLRGPHLLPVDDPLVTVEHGRGLQRREVRARVRLAEPLTPRDLALQDLRQELLLLLLGAPLEDRRSDERVTEEISAHRRAGTRELLVQHDVVHDREALASVLLRP